jgi:hypothetical protein
LTGPGEGVHAAQGIGQPEAPGHVPYQVSRVVQPYSGGGDEQRPR